MDLEELIQKYPNISRIEMEKLRETEHYPDFSEDCFELGLQLLDDKRENEKIRVRESVIAGPLIQVLSVHYLPSDNNKLIDQNKPLTTYGRIYAEFRDTTSGKTIVHDLYNRKCDDAQVLGPNGGPLTLIGPDFPHWPFPDCMSLNNNTRLVVDVFTGVEGNNLFAEKQFCCPEEDMTTNLEKVKLEYVHGELGSLVLRYIAMPFAVYGHVKVEFIHKKLDEENLQSRSLNVIGKVVVGYGNHPSEECFTLFEKQCDNEFERVEIDMIKCMASMKLYRCWVGVPAYSSIILDVDLSEFGTERKLLKEMVEFPAKKESVSADDFIVDNNILIHVSVGWCSSKPQGRQESCGMELEDDDDDDDESSDDEMSNDDQMDEASCVSVASSSNLRRPWVLHAHKYIMPLYLSTSFVEIFSVFIGREKFKPLQVYGSIQVASDACKFYVFKREVKEDAFGLSEHSKTIPVLDGPRVYNGCDSLEMEIDLKDVESPLHIKGYVYWDWRRIDTTSNIPSPWVDKQLCSVIQGQHGGFAAIHYTIFSEQVEYATVELLYIPKNGGHVDERVYPKVHGSLVAQYNNYDYTSRYNKDYYRIVLLKRNREDPAQIQQDGLIALSRSVVAVPMNSSLIIEANLGLSDQFFSKEFEFEIGALGSIDSKTIMEENNYSIHIYVKWG